MKGQDDGRGLGVTPFGTSLRPRARVRFFEAGAPCQNERRVNTHGCDAKRVD